MSIYTNAADGQAADPSGTAGAIQKAKDMTQDPSTQPAQGGEALYGAIKTLYNAVEAVLMGHLVPVGKRATEAPRIHLIVEKLLGDDAVCAAIVALYPALTLNLAAPQPAPTAEPRTLNDRSDELGFDADGDVSLDWSSTAGLLSMCINREGQAAWAWNCGDRQEYGTAQLGAGAFEVLSPLATIAAELAQNEWRDAIDDALVVSCLDCIGPDEAPTAALERLIAWEVEIALDPAVSERAAALVKAPTAEPVALRAKLGAALLAHPNAVRTLIEEALNMLETPTAERPCAVCNGAGVLGTPGAPCPFCKLHALGVEHKRLGLEGLNIDRVLSIADEHAADSAEDGTRTFDRGGLMAFADDCVRVASQTKERTEPAADQWCALFWEVARIVNCLPSTFPDANAHVFRALTKLAGERERNSALLSDERLSELIAEAQTKVLGTHAQYRHVLDAAGGGAPLSAAAVPLTSKAKTKSLIDFHEFFRDRGELLFQHFGMHAIHLYNAVTDLASPTSDAVDALATERAEAIKRLAFCWERMRWCRETSDAIEAVIAAHAALQSHGGDSQ